MPSHARIVGWDADGVLLDSNAVACKAAEDIVALFQPGARIASRLEYRAVFGGDAHARLVGPKNAATLRAMHRLLMRARAPQVPLFEECLGVLRRLRSRPILITAAFADGVRHVLGAHASLFVDIRGREVGPKEQLLAGAASTMSAYVTDTVRDVNRCRECGIPVIAVTWGYDTADALRSASPDFLAGSTLELEQALSDRSLLITGGHHAP